MSSPFPLSDSDMPDHDLEPPRFAQLALERVLQDWNALKSMIMFGSQENKDPWVSEQNSTPSISLLWNEKSQNTEYSCPSRNSIQHSNVLDGYLC